LHLYIQTDFEGSKMLFERRNFTVISPIFLKIDRDLPNFCIPNYSADAD